MQIAKERERPFFSVVIPTYNCEEFIERTLNFVFSQDYSNYEVVVSDDGSEDKTRNVVQSVFLENPLVKTQLIENSHRGPGAARNQGIINTTGEWVAFLDSDDRWRPNKLSSVARCIKTNSEPDLWCHNEIIRLKNRSILIQYERMCTKGLDLFLSLYRQNCLSTSAVTVRKEKLLEGGLFDETLLSAQDYDLWLRLSEIVKIGFMDAVLGEYQVRENNISANYEMRLRCLLVIQKKYQQILKKKVRNYRAEELRFKSSAYINSGIGMLRNDAICQKVKGVFWILKGFIFWPFQSDLFNRFHKRIFSRTLQT